MLATALQRVLHKEVSQSKISSVCIQVCVSLRVGFPQQAQPRSRYACTQEVPRLFLACCSLKQFFRLLSMARVGNHNQMDQVVLLELVHGSCTFCSSFLLKPEDSLKSRVFLLSENTSSEVVGAHALEGVSVTERMVAFKKRIDELGATRVTVHTGVRGRALLTQLQRLLFTSLYSFDYRLCNVTCPCCSDVANTVSPDEVEEEVKTCLQSLPPLRGGIRLLTSSLIPGDLHKTFKSHDIAFG